MKANELRIGNLIASGVKYNDTSVVGKVLSIGLEECAFEQIYCECPESFEWFFKDNYCGIPLTPEILEKCGFKKRRDGEYLYSIDLDKHISIVVNKDNFFPMLLQDAEFSGGELNVYFCNLINYLHQLQNLYFALTGEELELKL